MHIDNDGGVVGTVAAGDPIAEALAEIEAKKRDAQARLADAQSKRMAAAEDPEKRLAAAKADLARIEHQAAVAAHELAAEEVYRNECLTRGDDLVARIATRSGPIVLRAETEPEADQSQATLAAHQRAADRANDAKERKLHERNVELAARDAIRKCVLSDLAHFDRATARYPALWGPLSRAHNALNSGRVVAEGKGDAA